MVLALCTTMVDGAAVALPAAAPEAAALGPAQAADEASAMLMARLQDRKIEVLSARTEHGTTWALPSGALQTSVYAGPIRTRKDGVWQDIDTSLRDTGPSLEPKAATAEVKLSDGGDDQLASVTKGSTSFGLGWEDTLPAPRVKGATASYGLGHGQTLEVTALEQGFSQNVILAQAPGEAVSYRIPLNLKGLKLSQAKSGHLLLKDDAGKLVAEAPAPMMWDSSKDPRSGESKNAAPVDTKVETGSDGSQTLVLTPDADFLAQADLQYPVTVDPTSTLAVTTDTWVQTPDYPDSQVSSPELKSGTYDTGTNKARSYLKFDVAAFQGKHILDTNLALYSYYSSTCSTAGAGTEVRRITGDWTSSAITWAAQPATTATGAVVNKAALGYSSSCAAGTMNFDVDAIVQAWASGSANYGLRIAGADETDATTWRRFRSANYISGDDSVEPHLTVTYNSYPAATTAAAVSPSVANAYNGKRYVTSLTPMLSAKVSDADGGTVKAQFEVTPDPAYNDTTYTYTATTAAVASGGTAKLTIPSANAFPAGSHLRFRVRGFDDSDYGSWSGYTTFVLNTAKPTAPTIVCDPYAKDTWTAKASSGAQCTLDTSATDGQGFYWGLDDPNAPNRIDDTTDGSGGDPLTVTVKPGEGWHSLYAKTIDSGGNLSTTTTEYRFGVGADGAAMISPRDGDRPARRVALTSTGRSSYTGVTYQYRRGETDSWKNVPLADVTRNADGSAVASWPLASPSGAPAALTWTVTTSIAQDGPIDVRAAFTDGTTSGYSQPVTVTVDREAGDAPTQEVGPGEVNMLTGDFAFTESDASGFGVSATRSTSSRRATADQDMEGQAAIYGPDWISGITADTSGSAWTSIRQTSATSVELVDAQGGGIGFTATSASGWKPEPGSESLTLTGSLTGSFTLKESAGTTTTFAKVDPAATTWQSATSYRPTSNSTTTVVSEKVVAGTQTLARPKYVIAPTSAVSADTCAATPTTKGCRILEFVYAGTTTATASTFGDYTGQVKEIRLRSTTPGASSATSKTVETYAYDTTGHLRQAWNPLITPALKTEYEYDSAGRVTKLTPAGELPWSFSYGKAGNAATAGDGMLLKTSRPGLHQGSADVTEGSADTQVVYDVPLTGSSAPYGMGPTEVQAWGQTDVPTDATAIFPADTTPASNDGRTLTAGSYKRATITYIDASGRGVNTADPGGYITTNEYNALGGEVRELTAGNRRLALATAGNDLDRLVRLGLGDVSTAERAQQLSTSYVYSSDGRLQLEELEPLHLTTLTKALPAGAGGTDVPAGTEVAARAHTVTDYDGGRPTDGTAKVSDLPTQVTVGARVDGYPADGDVRITKTTYDWARGLTTSTVEDAGGLNLTKSTTYDAQGRVSKTSLPKSNGADAGTTVTTYWSATGTGTCQGRPEWADLPCSTTPAAAITGGGSNPGARPARTVEYDWWGSPEKVTESANGVTRTTTLSMDGAGRLTAAAVTGGLGTAAPSSTTTYDAASGRVATAVSNGKTITTAYDKLGRIISYNDGAGNTRTAEYDLMGRPLKVSDSAPSTLTFTYDTAKEARGLPTSLTDSVAGTFAASYGPDGELTSENLPGGYTLNLGFNEIGEDTSRVYSRDSDGAVALADSVDYSVHGQIVHHNGTAGDSTEQNYTYDKAGRLTRTDDTAADETCTRRAYTLDDNSNRTGLATSVAAAGAGCSDTGATTAANAYDSADRLIATGVAYDAFGRTTTQANGATLEYYTNDLIRRQTAGTQRQTWDLDAAGRLASWTTETQDTGGLWTQTAQKTNHYGSTSDSPDWVAEDAAGTISRNVHGLTGKLEATTAATGGTVLQLTGIHGDIGVTLPLDTTKAPTVLRQDEYGNALAGSTTTRYGWLGGELRSSETPTGAILMGVRMYDPTQGRFLSMDPVPGGSDNAYDYVGADPLNQVDLDGKWHNWRTKHYFWGKVIGHSWSYWDSWGWDAGLHTGSSVRIYFNWWATQKMANEGPYILTMYGFIAGAIACINVVAGAIAAIYGAYAALIVWWAYRAKERGKCLKLFITWRIRGSYPVSWVSYSYVSR
ncbi:DNRLRE domain-containing protein [Streptomyces rhizosphaerihabitans]|uniref:DNRLRE domain-containing protein n=1 Tax=Streptomyces rhizosphaerihabitans TaxID=1266770 RepID=UPI0021BFD0E2|nr:DNRLRE domain-containing protein [Streptomyces rhizosphaerihabitans]MCT9011291.1 DNRLRE domain-containing protein [Streptomyces rhizosphaerihabitans]